MKKGKIIVFVIFFAAISNHFLSISIFFNGFFPMKPLLQGISSNDTNLLSFLQEDSKQLNLRPKYIQEMKKFERMVLIVIDALRTDLAFSRESQFPFLHQLIEKGQAVHFQTFAASPTVTLPRLKAILTGSLPSFSDIIHNFNSSQLKEDNLLLQLYKAGKEIIFYGDDTWLKLFPSHFFKRSEGVSSFFVYDTIEVDNNVTRHLEKEIRSRDWQVLCLHYLGLDHIGHSEGSSSPLMPKKQKEMDEVIKKVFTSFGEKDLLVLLGDHGMKKVRPKKNTLKIVC